MMARWLTIAAAGILVPVAACSRAPEPTASAPRPRAVATAALASSREELAQTIERLRASVARDPRDARSAVSLADALLRQTRVTNNAGLANEAARVLTSLLNVDPDHYEARRMLAAVYLSHHRFRDALAEAARCLAVRRDDDFVYGVVGDAHLELGEYPEAFAAFDTMNATKPTAASYARASYARELQGDLVEATRFMQMATEATPPQDYESLAWHAAQLGHLHLEQGQLALAKREYARAHFLFPDHPFAIDGLARVEAASGHFTAALALITPRLQDTPMPADLAFAGDLYAALGRTTEAERHYRLAEAAWRADTPEPSRLARFLAERGRRLDDAVSLARSTFADRRDIFTADALAWALFKSGQLEAARAAMAEATRTGTADRVILYHAAEIAKASGQIDTARRLVARSLHNAPRFDVIAAPAAHTLRSALGPAQVVTR